MMRPMIRPTRRALLGALAVPLVARGAAAQAPLAVTTAAGTVQGVREGEARVFRGVPFAAPPIGKLRFRPPAPPEPWLGVRPVRDFGPAPVQPPGPAVAGLPTSEDCLYLNIWAPAEGAGHPVFVWLHGGGNQAGTTRAPVFDGTPFAANGVVCVTVGYRLGAFGFLDLGSVLGAGYAGSGCNGLRDQAASLVWVRDNIAAFGGDPARVTLAGQSAGAKDVCSLLGAPTAVGLFQRAIIESGSAQTVFTAEEGAGVARQFAAALGTDPLAASAERVLAAEMAVLEDPPIDWPFRPVIDGAFLPRRPLETIAAGGAKAVTLLLGSNADEAVLFIPAAAAAARARTPAEVSNMKRGDFAALEPTYARALSDLSLAERHWRMLTAEEYWVPTLRVAEAQVAAGGTAWMYRYDLPATDGTYPGHAVHAGELASVWRRPGAALPALHDAWVRFIGGAPPGAAGLPEWPKFDTARRQTMILDAAPHVADDPRGAERRIWAGVL